jgi:hypothetical protein
MAAITKQPTAPQPVEGVALVLGGVELLVPALSLGAFKRLGPKLAALETTSDRVAQLSVMVEAVHAALRRNYPDMTLDQVDDMIDLRNIEAVFQAVLAQSGATPRAPGEGTPLGESTGPA